VDFSQFSLELDDWQVGLGRLMHLKVKQTKRRAIKTQLGVEIDTYSPVELPIYCASFVTLVRKMEVLASSDGSVEQESCKGKS
jgi:hypothetical protein